MSEPMASEIKIRELFDAGAYSYREDFGATDISTGQGAIGYLLALIASQRVELRECQQQLSDRVNASNAHDAALKSELNQLQALVRELEAASWCNVCCGKGDPGTGRPCICGGTGRAHEAQSNLTGELANLNAELDETIATLEAAELLLEVMRLQVAEKERQIQELDAALNKNPKIADLESALKAAQEYLQRHALRAHDFEQQNTRLREVLKLATDALERVSNAPFGQESVPGMRGYALKTLAAIAEAQKEKA